MYLNETLSTCAFDETTSAQDEPELANAIQTISKLSPLVKSVAARLGQGRGVALSETFLLATTLIAAIKIAAASSRLNSQERSAGE
jgi:hypothetical protein